MSNQYAELNSLINRLKLVRPLEKLESAEDELLILMKIAHEMSKKLARVPIFSDEEAEELFQHYAQSVLNIRRTLRHAEAQARCMPVNNTSNLDWLLYDTNQAVAAQTITDLGDIVNIAKSYKKFE